MRHLSLPGMFRKGFCFRPGVLRAPQHLPLQLPCRRQIYDTIVMLKKNYPIAMKVRSIRRSRFKYPDATYRIPTAIKNGRPSYGVDVFLADRTDHYLITRPVCWQFEILEGENQLDRLLYYAERFEEWGLQSQLFEGDRSQGPLENCVGRFGLLMDKSSTQPWQSQILGGGKEEEQLESLFEPLKDGSSIYPSFEIGKEEERLEHHVGRLEDRRSHYDRDDDIIEAFQRHVHQLRQSRDQAIYVNPDNHKAEGSGRSKVAYEKEDTFISVASIQRKDPARRDPKKFTFDEWFPHPTASKEGRKTYYIDAMFNFGHTRAVTPCWRFQIAEGDDEFEVLWRRVQNFRAGTWKRWRNTELQESFYRAFESAMLEAIAAKRPGWDTTRSTSWYGRNQKPRKSVPPRTLGHALMLEFELQRLRLSIDSLFNTVHLKPSLRSPDRLHTR